MEELLKLEAPNARESRKNTQRLQNKLKGTRDPAMLGELVDFYFASGSRRVLKVLTTLREAHSQDLFDKLQECIQRPSLRLPVLRLLAHTLNSQMSWLYRVVDHPLFTSILHQLKTSGDVVVLTSSLLVASAILPLVPSYISGHLQELFAIFCELATSKTSSRFGQTPRELLLHLDVAVYYLFLQLYSLFPCSLFQHLKRNFGSSGPGDVQSFNECIAPLFYQVQLHPSLVTDCTAYEASKSKWGAMEPHDIATLSLHLCLDQSISVARDSSPPVSSQPVNSSPPTIPECPSTALLEVPGSQPNAAGFKSSRELEQFWSPTATLANATPSEFSRESSHMSVGSQSLHTSALPSPLSDSAMSSVLHTPAPTSNAPSFTFKNYSPTASVDGEQPITHRSSLSQSVVQTPSAFEDSLSSDPLSQSMRTDSSHRPASRTSPVHAKLNSSVKTRIDRLIGFFSSSSSSARKRTSSTESEGFTEIFTSDAPRHALDSGPRREEVGEECTETVEHSSPTDLNGPSDDSTDCVEQSVPSDEATDGVDSTDAPRGKQFDLLLRYCGVQQISGEVSARDSQYSSSYPRETGSRLRTSNSETGATQTVLLVQERLQKLVESTSSDERPMQDEQLHRRPTLQTLTSTDSSCTLIASQPDREDDSKRPPSASRHLVRRVSVCEHPNQPSVSNQSPVALLDQYVAKGELLHLGSVDEIPLTELEGINWSHFGGCPHTQELAVKQTQVALLHSQLLFERYQCLQHARRNRRLLSRARTATQVAEQLFAMRGQLQQRDHVIRSLQEELHKTTSQQRQRKTEEKLCAENKSLLAENFDLKDSKLALSDEVYRLAQENAKLTEELKRTQLSLFNLENDRVHLQPQLNRTAQLQTEVESLARELQVLGELYQQASSELAMQQAHSRTEWHGLNSSLSREKEASERWLGSVRQELHVAQARVGELEGLVSNKQEEVAALQTQLSLTQSKYREMIKVVEDKYSSVKLVGQQLEGFIMELKGKAFKKKSHVHRHRRSNSHPTGNTPPVTSSPSADELSHRN